MPPPLPADGDRPVDGAVLVVHHRVPGPWSPNPRDRQVAQRIADLRALGFEVAAVALEPQASAGAPEVLASWDVALLDGGRAARTAIEAHVGLLWVVDAVFPPATLDAIAAHPGPVVVDLDRLGSIERRRSATAWRASERPGSATVADVDADHERRLLAAATLVVAAWPSLVDDVAHLAPDAPVVHVPPTIVGRRARRAGNGIVVPGRWSSEARTPDEQALRHLLDSVSALGLREHEVVTVAEDAEPRLRAVTQRRSTQAPRGAGITPLLEARLAWCTRFEGEPTRGRLMELAAIGLPFVTSPTAVADLELGPVADHLVAADHLDHVQLAKHLLVDDDRWDEVSDLLVGVARAHLPATTRPALLAALRRVGLTRRRKVQARPEVGADDPPEVRTARRGGTLAAVDHRIDELEELGIPRRLMGRDESILTQSFVDPDLRWRQLHTTHFATDRWRRALDRYRPDARFSLLLPTWNTPADTLSAAIDSVIAQTYPHWELCIVDDGSTDESTLSTLEQYAQADPQRIRLQLNRHNQGISGASNDALGLARHDWVALLDHDDLLEPDALAWVATYIAACPEVDLWYSDEDKVDARGDRVAPFVKPDWSPDLLLAVNYVCHLLVTRRALVNDVGGFRSEFDGAQDWDLVLRLTERTDAVGHIARPLYSWRMIEGSTAVDTSAKPAAHLAGQAAVRDALARRGIDGDVVDGTFPTTHRVRYRLDREHRISVVVPTRDRVDLLAACLASVRANQGDHELELVVVDNHSSDPDTLDFLEHFDRQPDQRVVRYPHEFSFARQMNLGARSVAGDLLLLLNNDTTIATPDWLDSMAELATRPEVGMVGVKLMFPPHARDGRPQHEGIALGMAGLAYNLDLGGYMGLDNHIRNTSGVTAACAMMRTSVFFEVGGMEERLRVAYNDVDLGIRIGEAGYRILYTPFAVLEHPESASRHDLHPTEDEAFFIERWGPKGAIRDPFVSPHLEWMMPLYYKL